MSLFEALAQADADDAAAFAGYLVLQADPDAPRDDAINPYLERFLALVGFVEGEGVEERQRKVDEFFAARPLAPQLLSLLDAAIGEVEQAGAAAADRVTASAAVLLDNRASKVPVGHGQERGALRGGTAGLLQARLGLPKGGPAR